MHLVTVKHNFETGHRLPHIAGKCQHLHGHSWWASVTVAGPELEAGILTEFGPFKRLLRDWIDSNLDHGMMLGPEDPLIPVLQGHGCKIYVTPGWPTVEATAVLIAEVADTLIHEVVRAPGARVVQVDVQETHVNQASWRRFD
jgi:6-pyruvoyltetrahydropterin/6-carboxytetrahydropterin synthase